jgi:hypothetical protein
MPNRAIALVEACAEDWPSYLADHIYLVPWPEAPGALPEAVTLSLRGSDDQAFWRALLEAVPGALQASDETARRAVVRDWLNGAGVRVLYVPVGLRRHGRRLPAVIRGADVALAGLGDLAPGTRVLVLIACLRTRARVPVWWRFYVRPKLARIACCRRVPDMGLLDTFDVEAWWAGFPLALRPHYDRDQLKGELLTLFADGTSDIRYQQARQCLVEHGALQRARLNP